MKFLAIAEALLAAGLTISLWIIVIWALVGRAINRLREAADRTKQTSGEVRSVIGRVHGKGQ